MKNFPGPVLSLLMLIKYTKKNGIYDIQSVVHCIKLSMKENVDFSCTEFRRTDLSKQHSTQTECYTIAACFPFEPLLNARLARIFFQDFCGPEIVKKKSKTFQEAWEP